MFDCKRWKKFKRFLKLLWCGTKNFKNNFLEAVSDGKNWIREYLKSKQTTHSCVPAICLPKVTDTLIVPKELKLNLWYQ